MRAPSSATRCWRPLVCLVGLSFAVQWRRLPLFKERHCPHCLVHRNGTAVCCLHPVLEAKLVDLRGLALSVGSEFQNPLEIAAQNARCDHAHRVCTGQTGLRTQSVRPDWPRSSRPIFPSAQTPSVPWRLKAGASDVISKTKVEQKGEKLTQPGARLQHRTGHPQGLLLSVADCSSVPADVCREMIRQLCCYTWPKSIPVRSSSSSAASKTSTSVSGSACAISNSARKPFRPRLAKSALLKLLVNS